jgi:hypothetical protein
MPDPVHQTKPFGLWVLSGLVVGIVLGFLLSTQVVSLQVEVDYDSARCRERFFIGPVMVREQAYSGTYLGSIRMPNEATALTGREDWRVAQRFSGNSRYSPSLDASMVLFSIKKLENLMWPNQVTDLRHAKRDFLEALSRDSTTAIRFVDTLIGRVINETNGTTDAALLNSTRQP